jgi:hypothetical protein
VLCSVLCIITRINNKSSKLQKSTIVPKSKRKRPGVF